MLAKHTGWRRQLTRCIGVGRHVSAGGDSGQRRTDGVLGAGTNVCCAGAADPAITSSGASGFHGCVRARTAARRRRADDDDACPVPGHPYRSRGRVSLRGHGPARRRPSEGGRETRRTTHARTPRRPRRMYIQLERRQRRRRRRRRTQVLGRARGFTTVVLRRRWSRSRCAS